jgi:competence protein ComEC
MSLQPRLVFSLLIVLVLCLAQVVRAAPKTLDIYFIDVEGGAATLIVTPAGESLLVDSGNPGERDAGRIAHVALEVAGLKQIDHYVTTHWHSDHVGGIARLARLIPVKNYYDHGLPITVPPDVDPKLIEAYRQTSQGKSLALKAGDEIKLVPARDLPPLRLRVLASNGIVLGEKPGAPQIQKCGTDFQPKDEDKTDNAKSLGLLLSFGHFRFFDGGDLTWNTEHRLVCPKNLIGQVDVFQVDHHGLDLSNNPDLVRALKPRVAIIDNGPRKGGEVHTFATLKSVPEIEAIFQLHRNVRTTADDNTSPELTANDDEACQGEYIKLSVDPNGESYGVSVPAKQTARAYRTRE